MESEFLVDAKPMIPTAPLSDDRSQKSNNNLLFDDDDSALFSSSVDHHSKQQQQPLDSKTSSTDDFEHVNDDYLLRSITPEHKLDNLMDMDRPVTSSNLVDTLFTGDSLPRGNQEDTKPFLENEFMQFSSTLKDNFVKPVKDADFLDTERMHQAFPEYKLPDLSQLASQVTEEAEKVKDVISEKIDTISGHTDNLLKGFQEPEVVQPEVVKVPPPVVIAEPVKVEAPKPVEPKPEPVNVEQPIIKPATASAVVEPPMPRSDATAAADLKKLELTSAEEMFCKFGLDAWFKPDRLHPKVESLIYWRDVKKSGAVFGAGLVILLAVSCFSVISVFAYASLFTLIATISFRIYKSVMQAIQKTSEGHPFKPYLDFELQLPQDKVQQVASVAVTHINSVLAELRRLFLVEDFLDSVKFGVMLWCLTYLGAWFNGMTLVILSYVALFTLPKVYENNKQSIDAYLDLVRSKIAEITEKVKAAIPIGKKTESEKDK